MWRGLKLLLAIAVLCCGLHLGERAETGAGLAEQLIALEASAPDEQAALDLHRGVHHHCAIDADHRAGKIDLAMATPKAAFLPAADARLASSGRAPPTPPPLA